MPGQQLQTTGLVVARQPSGSDTFEQLTVFSEEHGLLLCLRRLPRKPGTATAIPLDLFDEAELWLESSTQGRTWFIKEYRHLVRHPGLGRSYDSLRTASALAALAVHNPLSEESRRPVAALLRQGLEALGNGARPDLVWFKALYCFLRDEGHPVKQVWWQHLPADDRDAVAGLLNRPVAGQDPDPARVAALTRRLEDWAKADADTRLA